MTDDHHTHTGPGHRTVITRTPDRDIVQLYLPQGQHFVLRVEPGELSLTETLGIVGCTRHSARLFRLTEHRERQRTPGAVVPLIDRPDYLEGYLEATRDLMDLYTAGDGVLGTRDRLGQEALDPEWWDSVTVPSSMVRNLDAEIGLFASRLRDREEQTRWRLAKIRGGQP